MEKLVPEDNGEKGECGSGEEGEDGNESVIGRLKTVGGEDCGEIRVLIDGEFGIGGWRGRSHGLVRVLYRVRFIGYTSNSKFKPFYSTQGSL